MTPRDIPRPRSLQTFGGVQTSCDAAVCSYGTLRRVHACVRRGRGCVRVAQNARAADAGLQPSYVFGEAGSTLKAGFYCRQPLAMVCEDIAGDECDQLAGDGASSIGRSMIGLDCDSSIGKVLDESESLSAVSAGVRRRLRGDGIVRGGGRPARVAAHTHPALPATLAPGNTHANRGRAGGGGPGRGDGA